MKKVICVALTLFLLCLMMVGCEESPTDEKYSSGGDETIGNNDVGKRFVLLYRHSHNGFEVYVDTETGVQYLRDSSMNGIEWIPLLDAEGNPLIYESEGTE